MGKHAENADRIISRIREKNMRSNLIWGKYAESMRENAETAIMRKYAGGKCGGKCGPHNPPPLCGGGVPSASSENLFELNSTHSSSAAWFVTTFPSKPQGEKRGESRDKKASTISLVRGVCSHKQTSRTPRTLPYHLLESRPKARVPAVLPTPTTPHYRQQPPPHAQRNA